MGGQPVRLHRAYSQKGSLAWSLTLWGHHLEILTNFNFESVFYKLSLIEQGSMLWALESQCTCDSASATPHLFVMGSCLAAPLPLPSSHCHPVPQRRGSESWSKSQGRALGTFVCTCPARISVLQECSIKYQIKNMTGEERHCRQKLKAVSWFWTRAPHFYFVLSPAYHVAGPVVLNKYLWNE